jgi:hypothetical protein
MWKCSYSPFATLVLERTGWSALHTDPITPGKDLVQLVQEAGWVRELVCMAWKIMLPMEFDSHGLSSPLRAAIELAAVICRKYFD